MEGGLQRSWSDSGEDDSSARLTKFRSEERDPSAELKVVGQERWNCRRKGHAQFVVLFRRATAPAPRSVGNDFVHRTRPEGKHYCTSLKHPHVQSRAAETHVFHRAEDLRKCGGIP